MGGRYEGREAWDGAYYSTCFGDDRNAGVNADASASANVGVNACPRADANYSASVCINLNMRGVTSVDNSVNVGANTRADVVAVSAVAWLGLFRRWYYLFPSLHCRLTLYVTLLPFLRFALSLVLISSCWCCCVLYKAGCFLVEFL